MTMNWIAEAKAVIDDVRPYVQSIDVAGGQESTDMRIYFDLTILEGEKFLVSMDANGFSICNQSDEPVTYETINALLDANSSRYRHEFSKALASKLSGVL